MEPLRKLGECADHSWLERLRPDPETEKYAPNKSSRQVRSGHYVLLQPTKLPSPRLVIYSPVMAETLMISEEECQSDVFARFFSGDQVCVPAFKSWCTPYALTIMGTPRYDNCPFQNGNGYGDGRAVSVGEVVVNGQRWEMQLKGGGTTPFCRGADGRAVLRSSIREFLASEAMHHLGVETTRALSLIASGSEKSQRPWFSGVNDGKSGREVGNPDTMIEETCAITTRVAPSFLRVGHIDLFARRARATGGQEQRREHELLVEHAIFREFPNVASLDQPLATRAAAMLSEAAERFGAMVANWLRVGFCQGNFNADNCLVAGRTMDYGPFGWIEKYDPLFAKWIGSGSHFAFINQPAAAVENYKTLVDAVAPVFNSADAQALVLRLKKDGQSRILELAEQVWCTKLGFHESEAEVAKELWKELQGLLIHSEADFTIFFRQLAVVAENYREDDQTLLDSLGGAFYKSLSEKLEGQMITWLRCWLSCLEGICIGTQVSISGIVQKPELNGQIGVITSWNKEKARWAVKIGDTPAIALKLSNLQAIPGSTSAEKASSRGGIERVPQRLRSVNPKYIPREWMLADAYKLAELGDYSAVEELYRLFSDPYAEQCSFESKYYRRAPQEVLHKGGIARFS